ncbi:MAG: diguanylate cyclase, partial [Oscillospiraceae bacterium]|nr:diguanylate cyclase [Oscillospiraceae bacterium]
MRTVVGSDRDKCVGCNRCTRACPVETANLTYQDGQGNIKVMVDNTQCLACGACVQVCMHGARFYLDDTDRFLDDLAHGVPISLMAAPSLGANIPQWRRLFTWLRSLGVRYIYDVSLGADIHVWAHLRYMQRNSPNMLIAQSCPAIVSYCQIHRPELLPYLSPVHSPMGCTAVFMREHGGVTGPIAVLSPCIAKSLEFEQSGADIAYNVTFAKLLQHLQDCGIPLPEEESGFDHPPAGLGATFPAPGGFKENLQFFSSSPLRIESASGPDVYQLLDQYARTAEELLPDLFDVLSCIHGCAAGSACPGKRNFFEIQTTFSTSRQAATDPKNAVLYDELYAGYDHTLRLDSYLYTYGPMDAPRRQVSEEEIQHAFQLLEKNTYEKQNLNCGACGSLTCRDMARKIALHINLPINCIFKSRDDAQQQHRRVAAYIGLVHKLGETLTAIDSGDATESISRALGVLGTTFEDDEVALWQAIHGEDGAYHYEQRAHWRVSGLGQQYRPWGAWPQPWLNKLSGGEHVSVAQTDIAPGLFAYRPASLLAVPLLTGGIFWGFIALMGADAHTYGEEEITAIRASGSLIVTFIREKQLEKAAGTDALTGIYNRRSFMNLADMQFEKARRVGAPCYAMMLDLDFFKRVNDAYGHRAGDEVLRSVCARVKG